MFTSHTVLCDPLQARGPQIENLLLHKDPQSFTSTRR